VLVWLHLRRPAVFATVRTTLIVASVLSLAGFLVFPTALPRMADAGLQDSVSRGAVDLNHRLISAIYNPYAAVPSMHVAYALIAAAALVAFARQPAVRVAGAVYPLFVLLVIVATGNHFFVDAAIGAAVAGAAALVATGLRPRRTIAVLPLRHAARREAAFDSAERAA
jgi:membrane-associated phospholipid phosphatase